MAGVDKVIERVPELFTRRQGDWAQEGGNNTLIVMGTDRAAARPATVDDGLGTADKGGKGTGSILAVAGRKDPKGNPDHTLDDAFLYLSMKTEADRNLGSQSAGSDDGASAAAVLKSDAIRLAFRKSIKLLHADAGAWLQMDRDVLTLDMNGKCRVVVDSRDPGSVLIQVGDNSVLVNGDGNVRVDAVSEVTVDAPRVSITGDTTVQKTLTVRGAVKMLSTLDVTGPTKITAPLSSGPIAAPSIGVGGTGTPTGSRLLGPLVVENDVIAGGKSLQKHIHRVPGVKGGVEVATSLKPA